MRRESNTNKSYGSDGTAYTAKEVNALISQAKQYLITTQFEYYGYNFCTTCKRNDCKPVTCAHIKSVDWCKKNRCVELAWDIDNMTPEGLPCHQKRDKNNVGYET